MGKKFEPSKWRKVSSLKKKNKNKKRKNEEKMRGPVVLGMGWYRWERVGEVVGEGMGERGEIKEREKKT